MASDAVSIHPASPQERLCAYRNVHPVWGGGLPIDEYVARSASAPTHLRVDGWVLTVGEQVASSLECFPLRFVVRGRRVAGFGFGSVHTLPVYRRRGYAERLCRHVADRYAHRGEVLGLLFSNIDPGYYARLGYRLCPAPDYACETLAELIASGSAAPLDESSPDIELLDALYRNARAADAVAIDRTADYWPYHLAKNSASELLLVRGASGEPAGYVRLRLRDAELEVLEMALVPGDPIEEGVYRALADRARQEGATALVGWLRDSAFVRRWFRPRQRESALPMLGSFSPNVVLDDELIVSSHFWRADHF